MRKVPYTDMEIYQDSRVPVMRTMFTGIIKETEFKQSVITIMPDNTAIAIVLNTTVYVLNLKECIPGYKISIDPRTFDPDFREYYKLLDDEYVLFKQETSGMDLNVEECINRTWFSIPNYRLIDSITGLTDYESFQNEYEF